MGNRVFSLFAAIAAGLTGVAQQPPTPMTLDDQARYTRPAPPESRQSPADPAPGKPGTADSPAADPERAPASEPASGPAREPAPEPKRSAAGRSDGLIYGVDLSDHRRDYPLAAETRKRDMSFVFTKATEGLRFRADTFGRYWSEGKRLGLVRGAYHYAHPKNDPRAEADHFWRTVSAQGGLEAGDFLVLDIEETEGRSYAQISRWSKTFLERLEQHTGSSQGLMIYTGRFYASQLDGLSAYPLWVAEYRDPPTPGRLAKDPGQWGNRWAIHQYTDVGQTMNASRLSAQQLRSLGFPG